MVELENSRPDSEICSLSVSVERLLRFSSVPCQWHELFISAACGPTMFQSIQLKKKSCAFSKVFEKKKNEERVLIGFHPV